MKPIKPLIPEGNHPPARRVFHCREQFAQWYALFADSYKRALKPMQAQQQQNQQNQAKQDQTQPQIQKHNQMPKEEADRILDQMKNDEKTIQKNLRKREAVHVKVEKDW